MIFLGAAQCVYHLIIAFLYLTVKNSDYDHLPWRNVLIYLVTVLLSILVIIFSILLRVKIDFMIKPMEDIERLEIEEMRREQMADEDRKLKDLAKKELSKEDQRRNQIREMKSMKNEMAGQRAAAPYHPSGYEQPKRRAPRHAGE